MSEFDLKKSEKIGQLYPVLVDAKGNIIDGHHRLDADPNWRIEKVSEIDTEEKLLVARCVSNWHRRQVSREEKIEWINGLAKLYKNQGYKVEGKSKSSYPKNEIVEKITEVTGLSKPTIINYLYNDYKQEKLTPDKQPQIPASERIEHELGRDYVERHRMEVEEELRTKIEKEIREKILEEEIKPKVRNDLSQEVELIQNVPEKIFMQQRLTLQEEWEEKPNVEFKKQAYLTLKEPMPVQYQHQREWNLKQLIGKELSGGDRPFQFDFVTLGYSQKTPQDVVTSMKLAGVTLLIDIRRNPVSMYKPEFNKETIEETLLRSGIAYQHMPELGISRDARNAVYEGKITGEELLARYEKRLIDSKVLVKLKELTRGHRTFALMCTEVNPLRCHRHKIAELLSREGKVGFDL